ncbi:hypothetical protein FJ987_09975 [Mesorhizobium sp. CU2]|uniref:hypothetical protein n=1 Tax=unclassified Mesorhizobium TaxID=325217 RepID=UPI001129D7C0|nr:MULTISPECIES: hypothetical protein [unclassified Mesorhizobium]TPN81119.1 hypothetical protein FJ988_19720 [Mesorhizobium sp. CU3]TPO17083.1 hypothetical protein FJ987_09975 [Mesorhizobium sp. CU2]
MAAGLGIFEDDPYVPQALIAQRVPDIQNGVATCPARRVMANLVVDNLVPWFTQGRAPTPV